MERISNGNCPLCGKGIVINYCHDKFREYYWCRNCCLVFVPPKYHLSVDAEKTEYDLHQNDPHKAGYRRFLSRVFSPMQEILAPCGYGLDFGCGPGPTLSLMFEEVGHRMEIYDQFYAHNPEVFAKQYDLITATEVLEHLRNPQYELSRLFDVLKPNGILGIMTKLVKDKAAFADWHYKNDLTHVCFFSRFTFEWLAAQWKAEVDFIGADVIIIRKGAEVFPSQVRSKSASNSPSVAYKRPFAAPFRSHR